MITTYSGVLAIPVYIAFTVAAYLQNPEITPFGHWLSDLGNYVLNPAGAWLYNLGCILTAVLLALFYLGISRWYRGVAVPRKLVISYVIAQLGGISGSVFLVLAALFTLGTYTELHSFFSLANMLAMDFFIAFTATAFFMNPRASRGIAIFGFLTVIFNVVTTNAFPTFYIEEPVYFICFMIYVAILTAQDRRLGLEPQRRRPLTSYS